MGVRVHLLGQPVDGIRRDARLTWQTLIQAVFRSCVKCVDAENFLLAARIHDRNARCEVSQIFLVIYFAFRTGQVLVPNVASPAQIQALRVVDFVELAATDSIDFVATGPNPGDLSGLNEL